MCVLACASYVLAHAILCNTLTNATNAIRGDTYCSIHWALVRCTRSLEASSTPAIVVLRALKDAGWNIGHADDMHTAMSRQVFDQGGPEMKSYWQCLLELPQLLATGIEGVCSRQHPLYYAALRSTQTPASVLPNMKVSYYIAIMQGVPPVDAAIRCAPGKSRVMTDKEDSDEDAIFGQWTGVTGTSAGSSGHGQERAGTHTTQTPAMPREMVAEDPDDIMVSTASSSGFGHQAAPIGIPGLSLIHDEHLRPGQPGYYRRVAVMCPLCDSTHARDANPCKKYRNMGVAQTALGAQEPVAYLAVWARHADRFATAKEHIAFRPSHEQVKSYMRSQGWLSD